MTTRIAAKLCPPGAPGPAGVSSLRMTRLGSQLCGCALLGFGLACANPTFPTPSPQGPLRVAVPADLELPELQMGQVVARGVVRHTVALNQGVPGARGALWVYRPSRPAPPRGHPVVLIAAAGTSLLTGRALGEHDTAEHVAFAEEGYVVAAYELDGGWPGPGAYEAFAAAEAGLLNAEVVLHYLRERVPDTDLQTVFAVGHSSAGDVALLVAAHHPELAGVVVLNASGAGCWYHAEAVLLSMSAGLPGLGAFCTRTQARSHLARLQVPLFAFTSLEDRTVPAAEVQGLAQRAREHTEVELVIATEGDHRASMLAEGIPAAIAWMNERR